MTVGSGAGRAEGNGACGYGRKDFRDAAGGDKQVELGVAVRGSTAIGMVLVVAREGVEESNVVDEIFVCTHKTSSVLAAEFRRWCPGRASAIALIIVSRCVALRRSCISTVASRAGCGDVA